MFGRSGFASGLGFLSGMSCLRSGEIELENGAFSEFAVAPDKSLALLDDSVDHGEPEAGSLAGRLGGEEGLEQPGFGFFAHAHARVGDGQQNVSAGRHQRMSGDVLGGEINVGRLQRELTSVGHGVAGIDDEIHDDLLNLRVVDLDHPQAIGEGGRDFDILAHQVRCHPGNFSQDRIQREDFRLNDLLPAEGEKLACEFSRPPGRDHHALRSGQGGAFQLQAQQFGLGHDHHQQIVEVVRNSSRKPANGFHLLRLEKLFLR